MALKAEIRSKYIEEGGRSNSDKVLKRFLWIYKEDEQR
jgi:hypothetical protein